MGLSLMVQSHFFALKYDFPREHPKFLGLRARSGRASKTAAWPLGVPVIIVVGMVGGVFTPTESASIAAVYSLFVTLCRLPDASSCARLPKLFAETTIQFSQVLFCLGGASIFGWLLAFYQVPDMVTDFIVAFTARPAHDHDPDRRRERAARDLHGRAAGDPASSCRSSIRWRSRSASIRCTWA